MKVELEPAAATELHKYIDTCALSIASETTAPAMLQRAETTLFRLLETAARKGAATRGARDVTRMDDGPTLLIRGVTRRAALSRPCMPASDASRD
jgi:hypothetical protein